MRIGSRGLSFVSSTVLAVGIAAGATAVAAAHEPGSPGHREGASSLCDRPFSTTLLETAKVRIYALPEESTTHPKHREPAIARRPVFGCLGATGRSRLLDLPEVDGEKGAFWVEVDSQTVAANGPLVAYAYSQYYRDGHETWVRVRNLRTGAIIRNCYVGGGIAPHRGTRVTDIVLASNGEVGWNAEDELPEASENHVPGCNPTA